MDTRTNIVLDDKLIARAMARAGVKTKKAAVEAALRAFVREPDYSGLLELAGSGVIADDYDPKTLFVQPLGQTPHFVAEAPQRYATSRATRARATRATGATKRSK